VGNTYGGVQLRVGWGSQPNFFDGYVDRYAIRFAGDADTTIFNFDPAPYLVVTSTVVWSGADYDVTVVVTNTGTMDAHNVYLVAPTTLGSQAPTSPSLPTLVAAVVGTGGSATKVLHFPYPASGAHGARVMLSITGTYTEGSVSSSQRVVLP